MPGVLWVRLDTGVPFHDKMIALKNDRSPRRWQAIASYFYALAWSGGQGTDGFIPGYALKDLSGNRATADLLVRHRLWEPVSQGYQIRNYDIRQQMNGVTREIQEAQVTGGRRGACSRWHGDDCWKEGHGCTHVGT